MIGSKPPVTLTPWDKENKARNYFTGEGQQQFNRPTTYWFS
jgi:hypothetical protein